MARCINLAGDGYTLVDAGNYVGQTCLTVTLDPSEYQTWTTTSALVTGFDIPSAVLVATAICGLWACAWVWTQLRR